MATSKEQNSNALTRREAIQRVGGGLAAAAMVSASATGAANTRRLGPSGRSSFADSTTDQGSGFGADLYSYPSPLEKAIPRSDHTMTPLGDGRVLIAGGLMSRPLASVEILDPVSRQRWSAASMANPRIRHAAVVLPDGGVMVIGGISGAPLSGVEIYNPGLNRWTRAASLKQARYGHTAMTLPTGLVMVVGGSSSRPLSSVELYDPIANEWQLL